MNWKENLLEGRDAAFDILRSYEHIAVLGIKPESRAQKPAHYVPAYLQEHGYQITPVPTYYPEVTEILGEPVWRDLRQAPGPLEIVDVFRRPEDLGGHLDEILEANPEVVWLQQGIRDDDFAEQLARAGIQVIQDRCMLADHKRMLVSQERTQVSPP